MDGTFNPHHDHNNCCSLWNPSVVIVCSNGFVWNLIIWNIKGKSFEFLRHTFFFFCVSFSFSFYYYFIYFVLNVNARTQVLWFVRYNGKFFSMSLLRTFQSYFRELVEFFSYKTMNRDFFFMQRKISINFHNQNAAIFHTLRCLLCCCC